MHRCKSRVALLKNEMENKLSTVAFLGRKLDILRKLLLGGQTQALVLWDPSSCATQQIAEKVIMSYSSQQ